MAAIYLVDGSFPTLAEATEKTVTADVGREKALADDDRKSRRGNRHGTATESVVRGSRDDDATPFRRGKYRRTLLRVNTSRRNPFERIIQYERARPPVFSPLVN